MDNIKKSLSQNPLFVFALQSESAQEFTGKNILYTGVGKINAAYQLTKRVGENRPSLIVNLGSAGSNKFPRESIVCCTQFIQRDMDATILGSERYQTPFSGEPPILQYGCNIPFLEKGICGTGDSFEVGHSSADYTVIDMEAYALAYVAKRQNIPFLCLKYISDSADDDAADDWEVMVHKAAEALRCVINKIEQD